MEGAYNAGRAGRAARRYFVPAVWSRARMDELDVKNKGVGTFSAICSVRPQQRVLKLGYT